MEWAYSSVSADAIQVLTNVPPNDLLKERRDIYIYKKSGDITIEPRKTVRKSLWMSGSPDGLCLPKADGLLD